MNTDVEQAATEIMEMFPLVMRVLEPKMRQTTHFSSPAHFRILFMLMDGGRNLSDLAKMHQVSLPTMSNSVSTLVDLGLVRRTRSEADRRRVLVELTEQGKTGLLSSRKEMESHLFEYLEKLDNQQLARLRDGFSVLHTAFGSTKD